MTAIQTGSQRHWSPNAFIIAMALPFSILEWYGLQCYNIVTLLTLICWSRQAIAMPITDAVAVCLC